MEIGPLELRNRKPLGIKRLRTREDPERRGEGGTDAGGATW